MSVSSNSVFHYTKGGFEILIKILQEKSFHFNYCTEFFDYTSAAAQGENRSMAIPLVSFCDIPFSEIAKHVKTYGSYAIGLSKDWACRMGLNPVLYIQSNSSVCALLHSLHYLDQELTIIHPGTDTKTIEITKSFHNTWNHLCNYLKNYSSKQMIGYFSYFDEKHSHYYDENEWRYVCRDVETIDSTIYMANKKVYDEKANSNRLPFQYSDISYIVLENKSQIKELKNNITLSKIGEVSDFAGKIVTIEQIQNDF